MDELQFRALEYQCLKDGTCHCDWRLTITDCAEAHAARIIYIINIAISGFVFVIGTCLLIHRIFIQGHRLFDTSPMKGCLRPKPIDCMLLLLMIYNILRLLTSVILVADISRDMVSRSFIFEFPWQFGYGAFALYLVGIAQTLADSHKAISSGWLPSPRTVDIVGCTFLFAPFILNNICVLISGGLARSHVHVAETLVRVQYVLWFVHCNALSLAVLFSGVRLVRILKQHLAKFQPSGPRYNSVKTGIFKIQAVMGIIVICLSMFAVLVIVYGAMRDQITVNTTGSIFICVVWNLLGPVTTLCVEMAIIFNPNYNGGASLGLRSSSNEKNTSYYETHSSSFARAGGLDTSFPGTLSQHALEDLKQQQQQYQQVFRKHNHHHQNPSFGLPDIPISSENHDISLVSLNDMRTYGNQMNSVWMPAMETDSRVDDDLSSQFRLINK